MEWIESIHRAIEYIEENLTEEITIEAIAEQAFISPFYFQKGFSMLCGFTAGDYIRQRRLALAGSEIISGEKKVIDIAILYGYDSPDSFAKAFTRFHGITPSAARKEGAMLKSFAPLQISFILKGGLSMEYKIVEKGAFTVVGISETIHHDNMAEEVPAFWEKYQSLGVKPVSGVYGVCLGNGADSSVCEYLIAEDYRGAPIREGCRTETIPAAIWAVFPCRGSMPDAIQAVTRRVFSEWLPSCKEYEIAYEYVVELYDDANKYKNGMDDEDYYSEIWIPVKKK